jgi:5-formyltetrahydrofolate cyclo-ligase
MTDIDADKTALRADLRARRRALAKALSDAADLAAEAFLAADLPRFKSAALYHPVGAEMDPAPLGRALLKLGVRVAYPVVIARETPLIFREHPADGPLVPDAIGIACPPPSAPELRPDMVVVPMLGFDNVGGRIGQGGGFYDRTLAALRQSGPVFALGLAFSGQEVEAIPIGPYDQRLDAVLTEQGVRLFNWNGAG